MTQPGHESGPPLDLGGNGTPPIFAVGARGLTYERNVDGHRYLVWSPGEFDESLGEVAGWGSLPRYQVEGDLSAIEIPTDVRTAGSVLSGTEAWRGEKLAVIDYIAAYQAAVAQLYSGKGLDVYLSVNTVAVTRDGQSKFALPPHSVSSDPEEKARWYSAIVEDINAILLRDDSRQALIDRFGNLMEGLIKE